MVCRVRVESRLTGQVFDGVLSDQQGEDGYDQVLLIDGQAADISLYKVLSAQVQREESRGVESLVERLGQRIADLSSAKAKYEREKNGNRQHLVD